jgi:hypothetical protein
LGTSATTLGKEVGGVLGGYDSGHDITVELTAGQEVELWARSPQGDVSLAVIPPGTTIDAVAAFDPDVAGLELFEDSDAGIYGYDVRERFTPKATGTYRFRLSTSDGVPIAWKFTATSCADPDACTES